MEALDIDGDNIKKVLKKRAWTVFNRLRTGSSGGIF
jgi:hypothetical protein